MPRFSRLAPAVLVALALSVFAAAPASASSPAGTAILTVTAQDPLDDQPFLDFSGSCPVGTDSVTLERVGGNGILVTLDPSSDFSTTGFAASNWGGPGSTFDFLLTCTDGGVDVTQTASITLPDYGSSVAVPSTVQLDQPITASGTCGTAPGVGRVILYYYFSGGAAISSESRTDDGGAFAFTDLSTPLSLGLSVGDSIVLNAFCTTPLGGGGESYYTVPMSNTFAIAAPLVPVDHATLTATIVDPTNENSDIDFAGECGPTADHAELRYDGPNDSGYYYESLVGGSFTDTESADQFGEPGDVVDFTTHCMDGTDEVGVSAPPTALTLPDTGSALAMAASFTTAQRLTLSGTCGTSGATQVLIVFGTFTDGVIDGMVRPISGPTYSFTDMPTPAELGLGAVSDGFVQVLCFRAGDVNELDPVSVRLAEFTVTLPVKALSATGLDATAPLALGGVLLGAGLLLLIVRRRTRVG